jgi:hypothetical protein
VRLQAIPAITAAAANHGRRLAPGVLKRRTSAIAVALA